MTKFGRNCGFFVVDYVFLGLNLVTHVLAPCDPVTNSIRIFAHENSDKVWWKLVYKGACKLSQKVFLGFDLVCYFLARRDPVMTYPRFNASIMTKIGEDCAIKITSSIFSRFFYQTKGFQKKSHWECCAQVSLQKYKVFYLNLKTNTLIYEQCGI